MTEIKTNLRKTRESARQIRVEPAGSITQTNVQKALEQAAGGSLASLTITGSPATTIPAVNTTADISLTNTNTGGNYGAQIQFGSVAGSPYAVIGSRLVDGTAPGSGQLVLAIKDNSAGALINRLWFNNGGQIFAGNDFATQNFGGRYSFGAYNNFGYQAFIGYSRTSDLTAPTSSQSTAGGYFIAENDFVGTTENPTAYGGYSEARAGNAFGTIGHEVDCQNTSGLNPRPIDPNNMFGTDTTKPWCPDLWLSAGGSKIGPAAKAVTCAIGAILQATSKHFEKGIVFGAGSIVGAGSHSQVISMPVQYELCWYTAGGAVTRFTTNAAGTALTWDGGQLELGVSATTAGTLKLWGGTQGSVIVKAAANVAANSTITLPNGTTDFSATGGAGQFVKQASAGAAFTVAAVALSELSGFGTGVATALGVNVGSAGAPVVFGGALGTPSSGTLTNATGLPAAALTGQVAVANGGTGLAAGTSGGIPYFSGSTTIASSGALAAGGIVLGGGAGTTPTTSTELTYSTSTHQLQVTSSATSSPAIVALSTVSDATGGLHVLAKSRSGAAVQSGDTIGSFLWTGFANAAQQNAAQISAAVTGAPSGSNIPTELVFNTSSSGSSLNEVLRLKTDGTIKFSSSASFLANGSVATVLGSVGPVGSHTTVQKWLTIVDSGGATLFIPAF